MIFGEIEPQEFFIHITPDPLVDLKVDAFDLDIHTRLL
jgi:hypothetical protein